jgi:splicing factor U2AF subunit
MGRSRSREKDRDRDRDRDRRRDKEDKEKDRKRSRSRRRRSRSREKKEKKEKKEKEKEKVEERERSPSFQYRRWRFDSPPSKDEYQRDAMLTGNPMGIGGVAAALQGGLALAGVSSTLSPLALAADTKAMRELYVGNLPAGITAPQLVQFLNQVSQAVKVNSLPGEPVLGATMGGGGLFAFVEFRTAEEAANGLRLNGVELLGCQLKVGRPKGYTGPESAGAAGGFPGLSGALALPGIGGGAAPSLGEMMAQHGALRPGQLALPGLAGQGGHAAMVSAIDHRLCLVNIPTFVTEDRIRELLITFGQLKFFALQKDEEGKSVGVAFFEYADMMTQQQARAALEGLELGAKKLSVKKPEEVIEMGLVARVQKLGARVVPSRCVYLKNVVTLDEIRDDAAYQEICADIRLEAEKFGPVVSMEIPRPKQGGAGGSVEGGVPANALTGGHPGSGAGGVMALEDTKPSESTLATLGSVPKPTPAPTPTDLSLALVPAGAGSKAPPLLKLPGAGLDRSGAGGMGADGDVIGLGYAFIEFATIEGASKSKKAMNGRRFGANLVEAEYFSEDKYHAKDFSRPTPNTDEPRREPGTELALLESNTGPGTLDEAPVMVE